MKDGWFFVHGHFYQPPRENPWTGSLPEEPEARPWRNWNERILFECYSPNSWARIYGAGGRLVKVVNNYSLMSFDFGPTLLWWLEREAPRVYRAILEGDEEARRHFSGHGTAISHPYSHLILPLAGPEDRRTAILWGIREFEIRFGRRPEAMWLPECAVDTATLEDLAAFGMAYVLLSPFQARRSRRAGGYWQDASGGRIDPFRPYRINLPSGRGIAAFFYHPVLAVALSFGDLLADGEGMLARLREAIPPGGEPLLGIVTDGETFGHHKAFGEMAIAYVLSALRERGEIRVTVPGEFLELFPPEDEVEVFEGSSWSCAHGLGRWKEDCGCNTGAHPQWNQKWRKPLREALDWLRGRLGEVFRSEAPSVLLDPGKAKEDYVEVMVTGEREAFLRRHAKGDPHKALGLLEMEREALLMFTSCGWFFDDPSGLETLLILRHAGRAIDLARTYGGVDLEPEFLERLEEIRSNIPEKGTGKDLCLSYVAPLRVDHRRAAVHALMGSLFGEEPPLWAYAHEVQGVGDLQKGEARLSWGRIRVRDRRTLEEEAYSFQLLHLGEHHCWCGLSRGEGVDGGAVAEAFQKGDFAGAALLIGEGADEVFTLGSLLLEPLRAILGKVARRRAEEVVASVEGSFPQWEPLLHFFAQQGLDLPPLLEDLARLVLWEKARRAVESLDPEGLRGVLAERDVLGVPLDLAPLAHHLTLRLDRFAEEVLEGTMDLEALGRAIELSRLMPQPVPLGKLEAYLWLAKGRIPEGAWRALDSLLHPVPEGAGR